jgi:two-component system sensor histidine kinase KdpD
VADDALEILVIDRGPGLTPSKRSTLLDSAQLLSGERGASLGLSVALGFMDLLSGKIRAEDTPGGGLTIVLEFPLAGDVESD